IKVIALDKTGTITAGRPSVTRIVSLDSIPEDRMLALAAAIEKSSSHPLAAAIVSEARLRGQELPETSDVQQVPGHGMTGVVEGKKVFVGRLNSHVTWASGPCMNRSHGPEAHVTMKQLTDAGQSVVAVTVDEKPIALIGL